MCAIYKKYIHLEIKNYININNIMKKITFNDIFLQGLNCQVNLNDNSCKFI